MSIGQEGNGGQKRGNRKEGQGNSKKKEEAVNSWREDSHERLVMRQGGAQGEGK